MALPHELRLEVEALLRAGHSDLEIQRRLGVDRGTAARYRKSLGLPGYRTSIDSPSCRHGHPFPENARRDAKGWLYCRVCKRGTYVPVEPDWVAIERATFSDCPERLTPRERAAAVLRLHGQQLSAKQTAERIRCHPRTVFRIRARAAQKPAA